MSLFAKYLVSLQFSTVDCPIAVKEHLIDKMHFIVPKIINIGRILNLGKCFIITALFFLILHKGINYQQYGTIPPTSDRLISSTASTLKHTVSKFE